ncbi:MAG TPA: STAS domain-containing protein [Solirubrobacteraceae bacterium]|nr:STAS domain-containing protein [Solirubrobacteraceae bacterium]
MEMKIETLADDITKVNLEGRLDILGAQQIDLHFNVIVASQRKVIVDLEQVLFLASMGIRTLIIGAKTVKLKGGRMVLLRPSADVHKVLTAMGTDTVIPIVHDLEAAISAVSG